jgi:hypothetical protein
MDAEREMKGADAGIHQASGQAHNLRGYRERNKGRKIDTHRHAAKMSCKIGLWDTDLTLGGNWGFSPKVLCGSYAGVMRDS